jgi:hypothetical protein
LALPSRVLLYCIIKFSPTRAMLYISADNNLKNRLTYRFSRRGLPAIRMSVIY